MSRRRKKEWNEGLSRETYEIMISAVTKTKLRKALFKLIYSGLPLLIFISYPALLVYMFFTHDEMLFRCIAAPLYMFATLSCARHIINAPRPYDVFDITPVFPKDTHGKSFPSRHTASAAVIAMTFLRITPVLGVIFIIMTLLIGASRIIGGVHFPKDVLAGAGYAVICGAMLFL